MIPSSAITVDKWDSEEQQWERLIVKDDNYENVKQEENEKTGLSIGSISDLGLSRPADKPTKSNEIYEVLPYISPEVLRGKQYNKAADKYSFENEPTIQNYPLSCYTVQAEKFDYSVKLNEILNQEELSSKENVEETMLSKNLENCLIQE
ncbi:hypothetical protein C1645_823107 [Glomus cerebriforme]|uniref:Protein kinase domain-containing protein n=1 Tax=Glomus cerebriforme TaxID=658196 RepID=A0A397T320_9GLOM|nr:hypothetical protein C1645_823107 [Glomus cerebriforme]